MDAAGPAAREKKKPMEQKFNGDIGQVAGRDVRASSAQSTVSVHIHNGPKLRYISERQRAAIARWAFRIQAKTRADNLMVYRRLMTVFKFPNMDEMPADIYQRVISYLDAWLKNGTTDQSATNTEPRDPALLRDQQLHQIAGDTSEARIAVHASARYQTTSVQAVPTLMPEPKRHLFPWRSLAASCAVIAVLAVVTYVVVERSNVPAQQPVATTAPQCEYGGNRYSLGSVVMQAGIRQHCVAIDGHSATWQRLEPSRRH